jgi:hypothetical protein
MSFFSKVFKGIKKVGKAVVKGVRTVANVPGVQLIPGVGQIATAVKAVDTFNSAVIRPATSPTLRAIKQVSSSVSQSRMAVSQPRLAETNLIFGGKPQMSLLTRLPTLGQATSIAKQVGRATVRNAGTIGTVATAGAILYDQFGNPVRTKRRARSKGITARELKSFTRVTGILNKYCKTPPPMKRRTARSKSCR